MSIDFTLLPSPDLAPRVNEGDYLESDDRYVEALARLLIPAEELGHDLKSLLCGCGVTVPPADVEKVRSFLAERWRRQRQEVAALLEGQRSWLDQLLKRPHPTLRQIPEEAPYTYPAPDGRTGYEWEVSTPWGRDLVPVAEAAVELCQRQAERLKQLMDKHWPDQPPGRNEQCLCHLQEIMPKVRALARQAEEHDTYLLSYSG